MKDISIYFTPLKEKGDWNDFQLGSIIEKYDSSFPVIEKDAIAILYIPEFRGSKMMNVHADSSRFRSCLYALNKGRNWNKKIYDLGDILPGNEFKDSELALKEVVFELVKNRVIPVIIGGSQDLTYSLYLGFEKLEQLVNICTVDYSLDLGDPEKDIEEQGFLGKILFRRPCFLFNHANIGLQIPYTNERELGLFEKLYFDVCRLGEFNADFRLAEPHLRNADIVNIDFNSIKASETNDLLGLPNGFYSEQICQIAKYAGNSDKLTCFSIFNYQNYSRLGDEMMGQILWYFLDGVQSRLGDFPLGSKSEYTKFTVVLDNTGTHEIIFLKSNKSARWWMEVPYPPKEGSKYERHYLVPCDKLDYENAMKNEMPDLWWKTYQKLS